MYYLANLIVACPSFDDQLFIIFYDFSHLLRKFTIFNFKFSNKCFVLQEPTSPPPEMDSLVTLDNLMKVRLLSSFSANVYKYIDLLTKHEGPYRILNRQ